MNTPITPQADPEEFAPENVHECEHGVSFDEECPVCELELHGDDPELVLPGDLEYDETLSEMRGRR